VRLCYSEDWTLGQSSTTFAKWKSIERLISDGYKYSLHLFLPPPLTCIVKWPEFAVELAIINGSTTEPICEIPYFTIRSTIFRNEDLPYSNMLSDSFPNCSQLFPFAFYYYFSASSPPIAERLLITSRCSKVTGWLRTVSIVNWLASPEYSVTAYSSAKHSCHKTEHTPMTYFIGSFFISYF
jgi:hypothetical protein